MRMPGVDPYAEAWEGIRNSFESGRLAHAYVIVGSPRGDARQFAELMLKLLYCESDQKPCGVCNGCHLVESHKNIDVLWVEPQSKSRQIKADDVRALVHRMAQTSYEGGWKAGVVVSADCMNESSANALLKTLEEPPQKSMLLLITDSPHALLPTIISRCQRIVLSEGGSGALKELWYESLLDMMRSFPPSNGLDAGRTAIRLKAILDGVKDHIADAVEADTDADESVVDETRMKDILDARINARLLEVQSIVFRTLLEWHRDLLLLVHGADEKLLNFPDELETLKHQASRQTPSSGLLNIKTVENMARQIGRNIPPVQVFDEAFRKLIRR